MKPLVAVSKMPNYYATPILPLARGKVRYVGEPVVGVVAANRYQAEDALERITIDYQPLPAVVDAEEAARAGAPLLHEEAGTNVLVSREFKRGDVDAAFSSAAVSRAGPLPHAAKNDGGDGAARLSRRIRRVARCADAAFGDASAGHRARCACFGVRHSGRADSRGRTGRGRRFRRQGFALCRKRLFVCAAARLLARPVKWTSDRLEDLATSSQAFDEIVDAELALDQEAHIVGLRADVIGDVGAYSIYPWTAALEPVQVVSFLPGPYRVQNYRGRVQAVATAKAPTGPYRGVGRPISTFVMERLIDMAAAKTRHRRQGDPAAQSRRGPRSFPTRSPPASSGTNPAFRNA